RQCRPSDADGVRPPRASHESRRPCLHAYRAAGRGVGLRGRMGRPHDRLAREVVAAQARCRRRAHHPRRRLRGRRPERRRRVKARRPRLDLRRPLAQFPTIKLKLGFVIAAAVGMTVLVFWALLKIGVWPSFSGVAAAFVAMAMVYFLSRGMTSPLRDMAKAAEAMAHGDYSRRVDAVSRDEVGALARAFNQLAAALAETDRVR